MATNRDILFTLKLKNQFTPALRAAAVELKAQGRNFATVAQEAQKLKQAVTETTAAVQATAKAFSTLTAAANSKPISNMATALKNLNTQAKALGNNTGGLTSVANALRIASMAAQKFNENTGKKGQMDVRNYGKASTSLQKLAADIKLVVASSGGLDRVAKQVHDMSQAVALIQSRVSTLRMFSTALQNVGKAAGAIDKVTKGLKTFAQQGGAIQVVTQHIRNLDNALGQSQNLQKFLADIREIKKELLLLSTQAQRTQSILVRVGLRSNLGGRPGNNPNNPNQPQGPPGFSPIGNGQTLGGVVAATAGAFIGVQTITQAVTNMAEYDQALANVRAATAVVGETSTETALRIGSINKEVLLFGSNSTVGPKALLDVMTELGKAGLDAGNSMNVAKDAIALSQATGYDAADSAKALVVAMASFGLTTSESTRIADIFTNTVNATTADMADLAVGLKYAAPLANALGISINETSAVLGTLAQNGLDASTAGTSFAQMLEQIINPSKKAQEVLKSVGLSMADLDPRKKSLQEIFRLLRDKNIDEGALAAIFGTQGFRPAQILSNTVDKDKGFTEINAGTQNAGGEAARTASDRTNSLMGDFQRLRSAIEGALNYQGQENGILSTLREITQNVTGVIGVMSGLGTATGAQKAKFEEWAANIRLAGQALAAIVAFKGFSILLNTVMSVANGLAFLGGKAKFAYGIINTALKLTGLRALLTVIGTAITNYGLLGGAARLAGQAATGMGTAAVAAIRAIGVAALANPFGLILSAIGLVVAALVYFKDETFKWGNETVRVGDVVIALWETVKGGFEVLGAAVMSSLRAIGGWFSSIYDNSKTALGNILSDTGSFIKMLINGWVAYVVSVKDIFVSLGVIILGVLKDMYGNATEMVSNIVDALQSVATLDWSAAQEAMNRPLTGNVMGGIKEEIDKLGDKLKDNFDLEKNDYVGEWGDAVTSTVKSVADSALGSLDGIRDRATQIGKQNLRAILEARKDADLTPFITQPKVTPVIPPNSNIPSTNDSVGGIGEIPGVGDDGDSAKKAQTALAAAQKATQEVRDQLKLIGMTGQALEHEKAALDVINDLRSAGVTDEKLILQAVRDRVQAMRDVQAAQQDYNSNPLNGAKSAFQNYYDEAVNYAKGTETAWSNALSNVEDAFVDFAKTGEFSLKTVMNSFFEDMLRASYRSLSAQLLSAVGLASPQGGAQGATVAGIFSGLLPAANKTTTEATTNAAAAKSTVASAVAAGFTQAAQTPTVQTAFSGAPLNGNGDVQKQVWDFFSGKGLQPHQVAGIMGQVSAESGFNPGAVGDGGNAKGLFQWNDRGPAMMNAVGPNWKNDVQGQLGFAWKEMQSTEGKAFNNIMASNNVMEANKAAIGFERPSGFQNGAENAHNYSGRLEASYAAMEKFGTQANTAAEAVTQLGERGRTAGDAVTVLGEQAQTAKTAVAETPVASGGQMDAHVQAYSASLKSTFDQSVAGVQGATQSYTQGLQQNAQQAQQATGQTALTLQDTAATTANTVAPVGPTLSGSFGSLLSGIGGIASSFLGGFGTVLQGIIKLIGSMGSGAGGATGGAGGGLFSGIGGFFKNLFTPGVAHTGGEIGTAAIAARSVGAGVFRGAQRYHSGLGLKMDEFPTILQKGEYVIPRSEIAAMKKRTNSKSAASNGFGSFLEGGQGPGGSPASRADRIVSPGQGNGGVSGNQTSMTVINNIQSQDANSFRKSESQIGFETARSLNTQLRRTGNQHNGG